MSYGRRVVSPKIVLPSSGVSRLAIVLLVLVAIGAAFVGGALLGREESRRELTRERERIEVLTRERDEFAAEIAGLKQEGIVLGRTQQIDREANRSAQEQLKQAQDERLALEKEVSFLRRLISQGGGGILQIKDFRLGKTGEEGEFAYSFTVSQLIQGFGDSAGTVEIKVSGKDGGEEKTLSLAELSGSDPKTHSMRFRHFQNFEGQVSLPLDLEPENLIVEVKPTTKKLIPISETFPWEVDD